jgi:hypothetical protein
LATEEARILPKDPRRIKELLEKFDEGRGIDLRREVIADDYDQVIVTVFLKDANFRDTERLMAGVRRAAAHHLAPYRAHLGFAGDVAVSQAMIPAIVRTQVGSVLGSLLGCLGADRKRQMGTGRPSRGAGRDARAQTSRGVARWHRTRYRRQRAAPRRGRYAFSSYQP